MLVLGIAKEAMHLVQRGSVLEALPIQIKSWLASQSLAADQLNMSEQFIDYIDAFERHVSNSNSEIPSNFLSQIIRFAEDYALASSAREHPHRVEDTITSDLNRLPELQTEGIIEAMSSKVLETALRHILEVEGDFVDHPADPGGATKYGITQNTLKAWRGGAVTKEDVRNLTWDEAKEIYRANYWDKIRGDELPGPIAILTMDVAVNSGNKNAVKNLQRAVNVLRPSNKLTVDGLIGPNTLSAVSQVTATKSNTERLIDEFVVKRGLFYAALRTFQTFGLGWARRLVSVARLAHSLTSEQFINLDEAMPPEVLASAKAQDGLNRHFHNDGVVQTYGSFFRLWGGWATAAHVFKEMRRNAPPFAQGTHTISPNFLDAAFFGVTFPDEKPPEPVIGQALIAMGFPAGTDTPTQRTAEVFFRRSSESWIAKINSPSEPVVVGMSGGVVADAVSGDPVGILVARNSPANLDADVELEESFDFVALSDVWDAIQNPMVS